MHLIRLPFKQFLLFFILFSLIGCSKYATIPPAPQSQEIPQTFAKEYKIGIGDVLLISVWRHPNLSIELPVRPDGYISVPIIGEILAGGNSPQDLSTKIQTKLSEYIQSPNVTIILLKANSSIYLNRVRVTGAIQKSISVRYSPGMTILDLVLDAGGPNDFAALKKTLLYRKDGSTIPVRLDQILYSGNLSTNYYLQPGDIITIPEKLF